MIFDCDGTMVDSAAVHLMALQMALDPYGLTMNQQWYLDRVGFLNLHGARCKSRFLHVQPLCRCDVEEPGLQILLDARNAILQALPSLVMNFLCPQLRRHPSGLTDTSYAASIGAWGLAGTEVLHPIADA
jgi:hypothetical protein